MSLDNCILVATHNKDKLREIREILKETDWTVLSLDDFEPYPEPVEDGATMLDNALVKARAGYNQSGVLTIADDSGMEVDALDGRPGIHSARYAGEDATYEDNVDLLLSELKNVPYERRNARFRCVMALVGSGVEQWWEGIAEGMITETRRGHSGFGYDPVFWSPELGMTFAEASAEAKNRVSHRGHALAELTNILKNQA
jgi:XTP/dITP diphosphohydrolase